MVDMVNLIVNNGIGVVCVGYMIYFQMTTLKAIEENQDNTNILLQAMTDRLANLEKVMSQKTKQDTKKKSQKKKEE